MGTLCLHGCFPSAQLAKPVTSAPSGTQDGAQAVHPRARDCLPGARVQRETPRTGQGLLNHRSSNFIEQLLTCIIFHLQERGCSLGCAPGAPIVPGAGIAVAQLVNHHPCSCYLLRS